MLRTGKSWSCSDCQYQTTHKGNLFKHIESRHVEAQYYSCQWCDKVCKGVNSYNVHVYTVHKDTNIKQ